MYIYIFLFIASGYDYFIITNMCKVIYITSSYKLFYINLYIASGYEHLFIYLLYSF